MRKSAFGLNFSALTVSSGGDWTSVSLLGLSLIPRPREFVVLVVVPNVPKPDEVPKDVLVLPNMLLVADVML